MSALSLDMMATAAVVSMLTPSWSGTGSTTQLWRSFNSLSLYPKQRELESVSGQKQESLLTSVRNRFFFFFVCLESTTKCVLFGKLAFGEGMNIKTVFASAPKRSVSERASSWQCSPFAKWITSPVTPNCHVRSFCKWLSLLAVPFGQWFLSL